MMYTTLFTFHEGQKATIALGAKKDKVKGIIHIEGDDYFLIHNRPDWQGCRCRNLAAFSPEYKYSFFIGSTSQGMLRECYIVRKMNHEV